MGISPDRYQIEFDERGGDTQSLMVQNLSDQPLTINLSVSNWELDEDNRIKVVPPTERSLDQWIVINPLRITIPPRSPQTIRWAVMPRLKPHPGEYRAIIYIEEELEEKQDSTGPNVRMKMRYGLPIYAHFGDRIEDAQLNEIRISDEGSVVNLDVSNDGNVHARMAGNYGIWPTAEFPGEAEALSLLRSVNPANQQEAGFHVGAVPGSVLLPGNRRVIALDPELDLAGDYTLQFNADIAQLQITDSIQLSK
jgi:P pilus assembly chaperone PapD